jgi:hypothetical protein
MTGGNMQQKNGSVFLLGAGPLAAILLGMALVPLRGFTSASNFTFAFMVLTMLIAEYGGYWAAVATAVCSAASLDFFLTQPYLRLTIADKHDTIAFFGLALCGLIAATLGSQRGARAAQLRSAWRELDMLHEAVTGLESTDPLQSRLGKLLDAARIACPLAAAAVRDERNTVLAAFKQGEATPTVPVQVLSPLRLLPRQSNESNQPPQDLPFPKEGARVALAIGSRQYGWLDLWGDGKPAGAETRRTLSDVAILLALQLSKAEKNMSTRI